MHVVNLGVALWVVGSCFKLLLLEFQVRGIGTDAERLQTAFEDFKHWCSRHKIPPLRPTTSLPFFVVALYVEST